MTSPVKLTRWYQGIGNDLFRNAKRAYRIADTAISVRRNIFGTWLLFGTTHDGVTWVNDQRLLLVTFPSRAQALRAYQAAAALHPPPPEQLTPQPRRVSAGTYRLDDATISRSPAARRRKGRWATGWIVSIPGHQPKAALTLADAAAIVANTRRDQERTAGAS